MEEIINTNFLKLWFHLERRVKSKYDFMMSVAVLVSVSLIPVKMSKRKLYSILRLLHFLIKITATFCRG